MADSKLTGLSAASAATLTDLLYLVDDPTGTPDNLKATVQQVLNAAGVTDSGILVGNGTNIVLETGDTKKASIGVGVVDGNTQAANYELVLADAGKHIYHASGAGAGDTYTIPSNTSVAFIVGTAISFVNLDSNAVSIAITSDTLYLAGPGTTATKSLAQYGVATALKVASTLWIISGTNLS